MSKRFGRRQKRQMRARVAELETAVELANGLARHTSQKLAEHREYLGHVVNTLHKLVPNSALLPPKTIIGRVDVRGGALEGTLQIAPISKPSGLYYPMTADTLIQETCRTITLNLLETFVERNQDALATHAHVRVVGTDNHQAYYLSDSAVLKMNPEVRKQLVLEIAERLLDAIEHKGWR